jgi:hypothetical protein
MRGHPQAALAGWRSKGKHDRVLLERDLAAGNNNYEVHAHLVSDFAFSRGFSWQLHLALFGQKDEDYDEDKNAVFRDALGGPPGDDRYAARHKQAGDRTKSAQEQGQAGTRNGLDDTNFLAELNKFITKGGAEVGSIR